jgi:hypothetical protein
MFTYHSRSLDAAQGGHALEAQINQRKKLG